MLIETIQKLFVRDLKKLHAELSAYQNDDIIWYTEKSISNSSGNLCLHLVGNLNTYIGAILGDTCYIRNREEEFSLKGLPKQELLEKVEATIRMIQDVMPRLSDLDLQAEYPLLVLAEKTSIEYFLVHLATHLSYHLGQVNYHRRLLDQTNT